MVLVEKIVRSVLADGWLLNRRCVLLRRMLMLGTQLGGAEAVRGGRDAVSVVLKFIVDIRVVKASPVEPLPGCGTAELLLPGALTLVALDVMEEPVVRLCLLIPVPYSARSSSRKSLRGRFVGLLSVSMTSPP